MKGIIIFIVLLVTIAYADDSVGGLMKSLQDAAGKLSSTAGKTSDQAFESINKVVENTPLNKIPELPEAIELLQNLIDAVLKVLSTTDAEASE